MTAERTPVSAEPADLTPVQAVARLAVDVRSAGLPDGLRADVARRLLDLLGNSLAAGGLPVARIVRAVADEWGGRPGATVIGGGRYPPATAALVNGTLAHALDFDDTHLPSVLHPTAAVLPAALAAGEAARLPLAAVLDAAGVGIEVCVRLGMAGFDPVLRNSVYFERGQHATAICGTVGAAVAAAMLRGLDADGIANAAGVAASMGAGLLEANRTGGTVKRVHCGWAAHAGVAAADLAAHGLTGPPTVIEGRFGFLYAHVGEQQDVAAVVDDLGRHWELPGIVFKPYPCNHFTHAGIDAALRLRAAGVDPADIVSLELGVPAPVLRTVAEPPAVKASPDTGYAAAFSGPFTVAAALLGGGGLGVFHDDFTDAAAHDDRRRALAATVRCVADDRCTALFPHSFPAVLRARLRSGRVFEERVDAGRGGPGNPLTDDQLALKFRLNATRVLDPRAADRVAELAIGSPESGDVRTLLDACAADGSA